MPATLTTAAAWSWRVLLVSAVLYALVTLLSGLWLVMVPAVAAILFTALLHAPTFFLRRFLPRYLAAFIVLVLAAAILGGIGFFVVVRIQGQAAQLLAQADDVFNQLRDLVTRIPGVGSGSASVVDQLNGWVQSHSSMLLTGVYTIGEVLAELVTGVVLTIFLTYFLLADGDRMWSWAVRLLPERARGNANGAGHRAWRVLSGWITGTAIIAFLHGIVIGLTLYLVGTPLVVPLAVLVFIGSFIPIVGAFVFGGLTVLVTLLTGGLIPAAIVLAALLISNLLEGHVYQPLIIGHAVRLHPAAILVVLAAGGILWGLPGAILAIPLVASVHAAVKYLTGIEDIDGNPLRDEDRTQPEPPPRIAELRGGRNQRDPARGRIAPLGVDDGGATASRDSPAGRSR